jgi:hypothetical protein
VIGKKRLKTGRFIVGAIMGYLLTAQGVAACPNEDCAVNPPSGSNNAPQALILEAMTVPFIEMDFDEMPLGSTSVAEIQANFPGSVLDNISVTLFGGTGVYNTQVLSGQGLGAVDPDGTLGIISPDDGVYQNFSQMTISFSEPISEFGFGVGDWSGRFTIGVYRDDVLIASEDIDTATTDGSGSVHYIKEATLFNQVVLSPPEDARLSANWVVPFLAIPYASSVPVPALRPGGLLILIMLTLVMFGVILKTHRAGEG